MSDLRIVGRDGNRTLCVVEAESVPRLQLVVPSELKPFVLFSAFDAREATDDELARFAHRVLEQGCAYACAWGEQAGRVELAFDFAVVDAELAGRRMSVGWACAQDVSGRTPGVSVIRPRSCHPVTDLSPGPTMGAGTKRVVYQPARGRSVACVVVRRRLPTDREPPALAPLARGLGFAPAATYPRKAVGRGRVISLLALGVGVLVCSYVPAGASTRASSEDSVAGQTIHTAVKVMAADGPRVAVITRSVRGDCEHVAVWTHAAKSVQRFPARRKPCTGADSIGSVALAGTQTAWLWATTTGTYAETGVITATLVHPKALMPVFAHNGAQRDGAGDFTRRPMGHGGLLAFTVEHACDADAVRNQGPGAPDQCPPGLGTGAIDAAKLYRMGGPGPCSGDGVSRSACTPIVKVDGRLRVLAVDGRRIAAATESGITLFSEGGASLKTFPVEAEAAALSGNRLAVRTENAVEIYDANSGQLDRRFRAQASLRLQDLEGDILVTCSGGTITLRKLSNDRTARIRTGGVALAQLERSGLFTAGAGSLTFVPMREVLRRLGA
jgi:hypothetical protein